MMRLIACFAAAGQLTAAYLAGPPDTAFAGVSSDCSAWVHATDSQVCDQLESTYGITQEQPTATTSPKPSAISSIPPIITPTIVDCGEFYTVKENDTCPSIASDAGISQDQLYQWNKFIGVHCETLFPGGVVCIGLANSTSASSSATKTSTASPSETEINGNGFPD